MTKLVSAGAVLAVALGLAGNAAAANEEAAVSDPYLWLEGVEDA